MCGLFELFGRPVYAYGLMLTVACATVGIGSVWRAKRCCLPADRVIALLALMGGMGIIGAKALYLVVSVPYATICREIGTSQWYRLLEYGQVFYGGVLGGVLGGALGLKLFQLQPKPYIKAIVPLLPLGHAIGRIGCLLAGCCYGIEYGGPWNITYHLAVGGAPDGVSLFPVQGAEAVGNVLIFGALMLASNRCKSSTLMALYAGMYAMLRFWLEYVRGDSIRGMASGLSTSQWISLIVLAALAILWIAHLYAKEKGGNYDGIQKKQ